MHDLEVAIGTGGLAAKKHGCLLALQSAITDHVEKQLRNDKRPKKLHYIFETETPQSPAKPLQNLIVLKEIAADCRRWVKVFDSYAWGDTSRRASVEDGQREEVVDRLCWTELLDTSFPSLVPNFRA